MPLRWLDFGSLSPYKHQPRPVAIYRWSRVIHILVRLAFDQLFRQLLGFPMHAD